jgi:hypothetical protein
MKGITSALEKTWYIVYNDNGIVTHGSIEQGQNVHTPNSNEFEAFESEGDYLIRLTDFELT